MNEARVYIILATYSNRAICHLPLLRRSPNSIYSSKLNSSTYSSGMFATQQVVFICFFLTGVMVMSRPHQPRPFEYQLHRIGASQADDLPEVDERSSSTNGSLAVEETSISVLLKVKIYPFRKAKEEFITIEKARFGGPYTGVGEGTEKNGIWGAGIDFGFPDGSGFGYGEEGPFKVFSISRVSYVAK